MKIDDRKKIKQIFNIKVDNENIIVAIILMVFAILIALQSSISIINTDSCLSIDVAVWTNIAKLMSDGKMIYRDIFDHKGPVLLILYYFGYVIGKDIGIWLLDCICILIDVIVIYKIARRFNLDKLKSILVVAISMIFLSHLCVENPCTESVALPFILISLYEFIKFMIDTKDFGIKESICTRNMFRNCFND